jgi:quinoprotein relay system zinc metallohydrolase 2
MSHSTAGRFATQAAGAGFWCFFLVGADAAMVSANAATLSPGHATPPPVVQVAPGDFVRAGACADATQANRDGIANIGFIVGGEAVAVIDPGGSLADGRDLRAAIRARTALPIRYVIMTHDHPDHVFGGQAFLADHPVFVGHWRLPAGMQTRAGYDHARLAALLGEAATGDPVTPSLLVHDRATLDLGGRALVLQAWPIAHSDSDLTVLDQRTATLWTGDLLFSGRIPALDGSLAGWLRVLDQIVALPAARAVPGHGPPAVPWPAGASDERRYLTVLTRDVRAAIAAGQDITGAVATAGATERGKWALFDAYHGRNVTEAYQELQWE